MILKASQRGGGVQLGVHLLKAENEHVEIHEIRGFMADDLPGAMKEAQAVARGTKCKQYLFSVSLNPPESVSIDAFEAALEKIEQQTGLAGQPRVVVFHEKEGRRHCHAAWSRIDADTMTAVPLPHFKLKLRDVSRQLYFEHGWQMPRGLMNGQSRDPRNFSLAEWQQAKRMGRDPRQLKETVQECWAVSDSGPAFAKALEERGLYLAKGDRRGHVAVTYEGEVLSIARMVGKRTKEVEARLGDPTKLRGVDATRADIAATLVPKLDALMKEAQLKHRRDMEPLEKRQQAMREQHATERQRLDKGQRTRAVEETKARAARLRPGVAGLWDRLTGAYGRVRAQNEAEAFVAFRRDREQRHDLVAGQLKDRRGLQQDIRATRHRHTAEVSELHRDLSQQREGQQAQPEGLKETFKREATNLRRTERPRGETRGIERGRGPSLG